MVHLVESHLVVQVYVLRQPILLLVVLQSLAGCSIVFQRQGQFLSFSILSSAPPLVRVPPAEVFGFRVRCQLF